tara:strand:- start:337 stop:492 length:156 start_codon:yes stop_codon:yes gene_type:complete
MCLISSIGWMALVIAGFEIVIFVDLAEMPPDLHVLASIVLAFHKFGILANC